MLFTRFNFLPSILESASFFIYLLQSQVFWGCLQPRISCIVCNFPQYQERDRNCDRNLKPWENAAFSLSKQGFGGDSMTKLP